MCAFGHIRILCETFTVIRSHSQPVYETFASTCTIRTTPMPSNIISMALSKKNRLMPALNKVMLSIV